MPTYTVVAAAGRLSQEMKGEIALGITRSHSKATGAQTFFAQVIFQDVREGDHFMGGRPLKSDQVFVRGEIRAGRTPDQKKVLLDDIVATIVQGAATSSRHVWVYLIDVPPSQMVEFGKVLPDPGHEAQWLESMSSEEREFLLGIGRE